jgi:23S rRNA G2445 N2-methylase RlmL
VARAADFDLAKELAKPSFTPAQRDAPELVELIVRGDEPVATKAAHALAGLGDLARRAIEAAASALRDPTTATPPPTSIPGGGPIAARTRLVAATGQLARHGDVIARTSVLDALGDPEPRIRRAAIVALGKLGGDDARAALVARWDAIDVAPEERRSLAEALGKLGGDDAMARLHALDAGTDTELARRRDRAVLMADRDARRDQPSDVAVDLPPPAPVVVRLGCKPGLAPLLADELRALGFAPRPVRPTVKTNETTDATIEVDLDTPWSALYASRLWATAGIHVALPAGELVEAITKALVSEPVRALLVAWTHGPIRWRLGFASGHKRAVVWRVARDVTARAPELVNDPTATTWDVLVGDDAIDLVPRRAADPRFAYRVADVPAASHPAVAAALAWLGDVRPGDRVWDPFVGSGTELVERARRGAVASLCGSDLDDTALAAARANLDAARVTAELVRADATTHAPGPIDLILTNPPLGGRIRGDAAELLARSLPNFWRTLARGGRLVWITPATRRTSPVAERLGFRRSAQLAVDLGGVRGHAERWDRP